MKNLTFDRIYILRHGKTIWNQTGRLQGQGDSPLLESSIDDIKLIGNQLRDISFDYFFYSPLQRVVNTLDNLQPLTIEHLIKSDLLKEINFGDYNGMFNKDVPIEFVEKRKLDKWNVKWPNGESYNDLDIRVKKFFFETPIHGDVGILAHEMINRVIIGNLLKWDRDKIFSFKHPNHIVYKIEDGKLDDCIYSR